MAQTYKNYCFSNTCSIDYLLLAIWASYMVNNKIINILVSHDTTLCRKIIAVIENIQNNQWDAAKSIWVIDICKMNNPSRRVFDCFDNEHSTFLKFLDPFQMLEFFCDCDLKDIVVSSTNYHFIERDQNGNISFSYKNEICSNCGSSLSSSRFNKIPPWFYLSTTYYKAKDFICFDELPKKLFFNDREYTLICDTIKSPNTKNHFCAIFEIDSTKFLIDDLDSIGYSEFIPNVHKSSTFFYFLFN